MKHCTILFTRHAYLALFLSLSALFASCSKEQEVVPASVEASPVGANVAGAVLLSADPFTPGQTLRISWEGGFFYSQIGASVQAETVATLQFYQGSALRLTARHMQVLFNDGQGSNNAFGYVDFVPPAILPAGTYTIVINGETQGKILSYGANSLSSVQGSGTCNANSLQVNGDIVAGAGRPRDTYPITWITSTFDTRSIPMRAFFTNQASGTIYQVFTLAQVNAQAQQPANPVYGFDNNGSAALYIGEESSSVYVLPSGTYSLTVDDGSISTTYPFPTNLNGYHFESGPSVTLNH